jgi:hypothetical protein
MKIENEKINMNPQNLIPILIGIVCIGLLPTTQAVLPAPDGGYPGGNTAEGQAALLSLTTGGFNTAVGFLSLRSDTTGQFNTAVGAGTLLANTADGSTAIGAGALLSNTTGVSNTANGGFALFSNTVGNGNTANGYQALYSNSTGVQNTANGIFTLLNNTTGLGNTAIGVAALNSNTVGNNNIALGVVAGSNLTIGSNNIDIGNNGGAAEGNTIRIGSGVQARTFIAAIRGVTTGVADAIPVLIDSDGQLGTANSSRRFKNDIKPMEQASEALLALKPVTFHYKSDKTDTPQFGLIAEEVAEVNPNLVVPDKNGEIYTVRYDAVNAMLLNEFLKEHRKKEEQGATIAQLKKEMQTVVARLKEQDSKIQKVSAQIEVSKAVGQTALKNR